MAAHPPPLDRQSQVVSDAAQSFTEAYYDALNKRHSLAPFYSSTSNLLTTAGVKPDISVNGQMLESVAAFEALLDKQGKPVHYDVHLFDAQPVNPNYGMGCPESLLPDDAAGGGPGGGKARNAKSVRDGDRISFVVTVSGMVRYGKGSPNGNAAAAAANTAAAGTDAAAAPVDGPIEKGFTESWLLVPHWEALGRNAGRGLRKWVVVSQNFRAL
ncbi:nuclear transport factor 2 domain-containing protein [Xylariaceae sp. FL0255]|nr:nuclear transport factor 2 domain-containing protein [Xylariaceae sp. FL0255]